MAKYALLNDSITETNTTARIYFGSKINNKDEIRLHLESNRITIVSDAISMIYSGPFITCTTEIDDMMHILRRKDEKATVVSEYYTTYLVNSLLTNIMFASNDYLMKEKLDQIAYIWYYYFFIKNFKTIDDITHNVCFQLEEMIKTVLLRELTVYKAFDTNKAIDSLRSRLQIERLVNMGNTIATGINFRK